MRSRKRIPAKYTDTISGICGRLAIGWISIEQQHIPLCLFVCPIGSQPKWIRFNDFIIEFIFFVFHISIQLIHIQLTIPKNVEGEKKEEKKNTYDKYSHNTKIITIILLINKCTYEYSTISKTVYIDYPFIVN